MFANDVLERNPLRLLNKGQKNILTDGEFGAVTSRAGVGKTAFMVQLALDVLLQNENVMHISISNPVEKIRLFYKEIFMNIAKDFQITDSHELWEALLPKRLIMTFQREHFSARTLEERITNLMEQNIFKPSVLLFDDLPFDDASYDMTGLLKDLKAMCLKNKLHAWFSVLSHRDEEPQANGLTARLVSLNDLFEMVVQLVPTDSLVEVQAYRFGMPVEFGSKILLDPNTMLISKK